MNAMDEAGLRGLLSRNIRRFRRRKGWSQAKLAEKTNMSTNYLSDIERGKGWVSPFSLVNLANALETEVFELFRPQETLPEDVSGTVGRCLEDFSSSLRVSFEKSLADSLNRIRDSL